MIGGVAVKDLLLVTLLILLLVSTSLGITAVAENGKTVILNANGTWKYDTTSEWRVVRSYTGSSSKNTDAFVITGSTWRIRAKTEVLLQIYLYRPGEEVFCEAPLMMGEAGEDESYLYMKGTFYCSFIAVGKYEVIIEEKVK